jgi:hypothetical protein
MGKRAPADEKPFNPVEAALVRSVLANDLPPPEPTAPALSSVPLLPQLSPAEQTKDGERKTDGGPHSKPLRRLQLRTPVPQPEKLNREKRVLLTQAEEREIERLVSRVAAEVSTPVKLSHLLRACVTMLRHAEDQIADHARHAGTLMRPSNGDPAALADFEYRLAQILSAAFRDAERLR